MLIPSSPTRYLLLLLAATVLSAQTTPPAATATRKPRTPKPAPPLFNTNIIFLDPAHGGSDPGAALAPGALEKDATLAFAKTLRDLLTPRGFTVLLTHESAATPIPPAPAFNPNANNPSLDARTEQGNRSRAAACIIIHAATGGHGVHLYTSSLTPPFSAPDPDPTNRPLIPWNSAQAPSLTFSNRLASDVSGALAGVRIPIVTGHVSTRPIDSLTCPAIAVELAPLNAVPASDTAYQQRVAQSLAAALDTWRAHALPPAAITSPPATSPTPTPKPKPRKPIVIPSETPLSTTPEAPSRKPAPIVRQPAPSPPPGATP